MKKKRRKNKKLTKVISERTTLWMLERADRKKHGGARHGK